MSFKGLPPARTMRGQTGLVELEFESDIDHAIYYAGKPVAGTGKQRSAKQKEALAWLESLGYSYGDIVDQRRKLIEVIRGIPVPSGLGYITVPVSLTGSDPNPTFVEEEDEDLPVEFEVIETEQQEVNEPAKVTVEVPFDQPISKPKRFKVKGRQGFTKLGGKKVFVGETPKSTAQKMTEAFDKNLLDPLLDSIKNPPAPAPPKQRKRKQAVFKTTKTKKLKAPSFDYDSDLKDPMRATNFNAYLGDKIGNAFKRAAVARREFTEQGGNVKGLRKRDRFITKALGFEFGGDKLARTRGSFSRNPKPFQDPALSKGQRFRAGLNTTFRPPVQGPALPPNTPADAGVAPDNKYIEIINEGYSDVLLTIGEAEKEAGVVVKSEKSQSKILDSLTKSMKGLLKTLEKNKDIKQKGLQITQDQLTVEADAAENEKARRIEQQGERRRPSALLNMYDAAKGGVFDLGKFLKKILGGGKDGDGGGDGFKWWDLLELLDFIPRRWKALFRLLIKKGKKFALRLLPRLLTASKGVLATIGKILAGGAATGAAIVGGVGLAASGIGEALFQLTKKDGLGEKTRDFFKKKGEETGGPLGMMYGTIGNLAGISNEATKVTGNALDAIGAPFRYAIEGIRYPFLNEEDREKQAENLAKFDSRIREYSRGWMNRIDFMDVVPDEKGGFGNIYGNDDAQKEMMEKMSEGGMVLKVPSIVKGPRLTGDLGGQPAMMSEAGPEMKGTPNELMAMTSSAIGITSIPEIIGAVENVLEQSGVVGSKIRPTFNQMLSPYKKLYGSNKKNEGVDIGEVSGLKSKREQKDKNVFEAMAQFLGRILKGQDTDDSPTNRSSYLKALLKEGGAAYQKVAGDTAFLNEVSRIAQKFEIKESDLLGLIASESGFDPKSDNGSHVGLIQFSADSARAVGTTQADLKSMSRAQQMKYVEKYFDYWQLPKGASAGQLYSVVFAPAFASKDNNTTLYSRGSGAYASNAALDADNDGKITVGELGQRIESKKQEFGIGDAHGQPPVAPFPDTPAPPTSTPKAVAPLPDSPEKEGDYKFISLDYETKQSMVQSLNIDPTTNPFSDRELILINKMEQNNQSGRAGAAARKRTVSESFGGQMNAFEKENQSELWKRYVNMIKLSRQ